MFGKIKLAQGSISIGDQKIEIKRLREWFEYLRGDVRRKIVGDTLQILPAPAKGYGVKLMMVRLEEDIVIAPGNRVEGFLTVPIEVSVRAGEVEVDRFPLGGEKYALYGTLERGVIVRYSRGSIQEKPNGIGVLKVKLINRGTSWGRVDRIVFPLLDVMYYTKDRAFYPLVEVIVDKDIEVVNTGEPPMDGLSVVGELKKLSFKMRW
ncbi:DUF432 domain-containing protein [Pyrococcus kukulkanii]|uniref:DUF432 domain-containing protein n=1 Tax=Pyrococcus kukulkanii TaxID=1609559 RepID=UPI00356A26CC